MISTLSILLGNSTKSVSNWKLQKRPIIRLLYQYFTKQDLEEFLKTGKIEKFEKENFIQKEVISHNHYLYLHSFVNTLPLSANRDNSFISFYFNFIIELKKINLNSSDIFNKYLFVNNFYTYSFNELLNTFLTFQFINYKDPQNAKAQVATLNRQFRVFYEWDKYMLLFLQECIDNSFYNLYDSKDAQENKNESIFHILGYYIFNNEKFQEYDDDKKVKLLKIKFEEFKKSPSIDCINTILDKLFL